MTLDKITSDKMTTQDNLKRNDQKKGYNLNYFCQNDRRQNDNR